MPTYDVFSNKTLYLVLGDLDISFGFNPLGEIIGQDE